LGKRAVGIRVDDEKGGLKKGRRKRITGGLTLPSWDSGRGREENGFPSIRKRKDIRVNGKGEKNVLQVSRSPQTSKKKGL